MHKKIKRHRKKEECLSKWPPLSEGIKMDLSLERCPTIIMGFESHMVLVCTRYKSLFNTRLQSRFSQIMPLMRIGRLIFIVESKAPRMFTLDPLGLSKGLRLKVSSSFYSLD